MKNKISRFVLVSIVFYIFVSAVFGVWDKDKPASSTSLRNSNPEMLANQSALENAIGREHSFSTGGTVAAQGEHTQGSAKVFFQDAAPSTQVDGGAFASTDLGSLWVDTNSSPDNQYNVLTATTPTWTPISTEVIAVAVAATHTWAAVQTFSEIPVFTKGLYANNSFLVARNAAGNGNVDLIKADASDVPVVPDGTETATNAAPASDKDLANKKYVDSGAESVIKAWADVALSGSLGQSFNVASSVRNDTGKFTVTWTTDFAGTDYSVVAMTDGSNASRSVIWQNKLVGSCDFWTYNGSDPPVLVNGRFNVMAIGAQ